jgi:hypothetical protein
MPPEQFRHRGLTHGSRNEQWRVSVPIPAVDYKLLGGLILKI